MTSISEKAWKQALVPYAKVREKNVNGGAYDETIIVNGG